MLKNSSKSLFLIILMMSTVMSITANSWLGAWMGLEINLLSFIPLMSDNNSMSMEAALKYFLVQTFASAVLLFSVIFLILKNSIYYEIKWMFSSSLTLSSLLMKMGAAPFHFWFPNLMENLMWMNILLLLTWQKIAPLALMSNLNLKNLFIISAIFSVIAGAIGGLNQTSLRKLIAFSSINHLGWMLAALSMSESIWMIYFFIYSFMNFILIYMFNIFQLFHLYQMFVLFFSNKIFKFTMLLNFLSLGGLPPFLGFFPKWLIIQQLIETNQLKTLMIMLMMALITLFFYLRICYTGFMLNYYENIWLYIKQIWKINFNFYMICSMISIFGLFLISMIFYSF